MKLLSFIHDELKLLT